MIVYMVTLYMTVVCKHIDELSVTLTSILENYICILYCWLYFECRYMLLISDHVQFHVFSCITNLPDGG